MTHRVSHSQHWSKGDIKMQTTVDDNTLSLGGETHGRLYNVIIQTSMGDTIVVQCTCGPG